MPIPSPCSFRVSNNCETKGPFEGKRINLFISRCPHSRAPSLFSLDALCALDCRKHLLNPPISLCVGFFRIPRKTEVESKFVARLCSNSEVLLLIFSLCSCTVHCRVFNTPCYLPSSYQQNNTAIVKRNGKKKNLAPNMLSVNVCTHARSTFHVVTNMGNQCIKSKCLP